jgi:DNA-binding CsgD family transcriptional regulator
MIGHRELAVMSGVARLASEDGDPADLCAAALKELRAVMPYECALISAWDPIGYGHAPFLNDGYPDATASRFFGPEFDRSMADAGAYELCRTPVRIRDLPGRPEDWWFVTDVLYAAGFKEGLSLMLFADGGRRYTGQIHFSTSSIEHPSREARAVIAALAPTFANLADATRPMRETVSMLAPRAQHVAGLRAPGYFVALPGQGLHPALTSDSGLERSCRALHDGPWARAGLLVQIAGEWIRARLLPAEPRSGLMALVAVEDAGSMHGLSARELEVVTLLTTGASNPQIAKRLVISHKTVGTHVGSVFEKLGVHTRTEAAVTAVREGLLVAELLQDTAPAQLAHASLARAPA